MAQHTTQARTIAQTYPVYTVDADRATGEWISDAQFANAFMTRAEWLALDAGDDTRRDTYEGAGENTRLILTTWLDDWLDELEQDYAVGLARLAQYREMQSGAVAYYDDAACAWYEATRADVIALGQMAPRDAYSLWCADTSHDEISADA